MMDKPRVIKLNNDEFINQKIRIYGVKHRKYRNIIWLDTTIRLESSYVSFDEQPKSLSREYKL